MARWALADDGGGSDRDESQDEELGEELEDADDSALDVEEEAAQDDDADAAQDDDADAAAAGPSTAAPKLKKIKLSKGAGSDACHVCGQPGHFAGFVGARYIDCANKPCYLCGKPGHSTQSCPHRLAPELACTAAADVATTSMLVALRRRERGGAAAGGGPRAPPPAPGRWLVDAAVLKLHSRRTTCLEFHPTRDNIVLSGDKSGQIAVWDLDRVFERTVLPDVNRWLTNALRFLPGAGANDAACATCSYDGTVKLFDVEIGVVTRTLVDANPEGWGAVEAQDKLGKWITFIGMDVMPQAGLVVAGDSKGSVYLLDPRAPSPAGVLQVHRRNTKVQSVSVHPLDERLVLTAGNDYQARLLDARCLGGGGAPAGAAAKGKGPAGGPSAAEVASFAHARVVNAAYFSPLTGRKILSTAQDNRLRVWDYWAGAPGAPPDREIVHSHTFNRHLTAFKAEWDPRDPGERLAVVGRYISEDFDGTKLHPIDLVDVGTGALVGELVDPNLPTICPVNKPHPRREVIVSGSSRSLYAWRPAAEEGDGGGEGAQAREGGGAEPGGGGGGFGLQGSANFLFFDAADGGAGSGSKKRAKITPSGKTKTKAGSSSKAPEREGDGEEAGAGSESD